MSNPIVMPTPPPQPGPPNSDYQTAFNAAYYQSRAAALQPFFYNRPGGQTGTELTQSERDALADSLAAAGTPYDEEIDYQGEDPYETMFERVTIYGYTREPVGQGTKPGGPVNPQDFVGPVVPGYLPVFVNILYLTA